MINTIGNVREAGQIHLTLEGGVEDNDLTSSNSSFFHGQQKKIQEKGCILASPREVHIALGKEKEMDH